jgi:hypothetical protein
MISKKKVAARKHKKPRGEQLLDRLDKNPKDQDAWDELARAAKTAARKRSSSQRSKRHKD